VAECCAAMRAAVDVPVTVKCRIGVDDQEPRDILPDFLEKVSAAGVSRFSVHARKAWLQGLSPKENRDIPPLDYALVHEMKAAFAPLHISLNGGVATLPEACDQLARGLDGVMIGRAAYHQPWDILAQADALVFGGENPLSAPEEAVELMLPYIEAHVASGGRLGQITKHMLGLFAGQPGARVWRRVLSEGAHKPGAGVALVKEALDAVMLARQSAQAAQREGFSDA